MPRYVDGVTFNAQAWDLREFKDKITGKNIRGIQNVDQIIKVDWDSSIATKRVTARFEMIMKDHVTNGVFLKIVLIGQYSIDRWNQDPLHGDMAGLPEGAWLTIARELYDTARGIIIARVRDLARAGLPSVPDEAFSIAPSDDLGLSTN